MSTPTDQRRRYPGAKPFERSQEDIFFGRQTAIDELYRRISLERLTVLYGKSGDGKSSLINAGIIPRLEAEAARADVEEADTFLPVKIRFEAYQPEQAEQLSPVEKAVGQVAAPAPSSTPPPTPPPNGRGDVEDTASPEYDETVVEFPGERGVVEDTASPEYDETVVAFPGERGVVEDTASPLPFGGGVDDGANVAQKLLPSDHSLWAAVKNTQTTERRLLLIFDQFEELFTYPEAQYEDFGRQLAELLNVPVPMRYVRALEENPAILSAEENALLHRQPKVHVLLAIRSDRLNLLNRLQAQLPNIQKINYELPPLSKAEAREAVLLPAGETGDFVSPAFTYAPAALKKIIHSLSDDDRQSIASFQLQILCESIEDKVMARRLTRIGEADVEDPALLYENYYRTRIARLGNPKDQIAARRLIEDGLILEEENRRLSLYEGQIRKNYPAVSDQVLQQLENDHLLRREPNLQGGYSYELSHDTLVKPIAKFKKERLEEERKKEVRKQRLQLAGALAVAVVMAVAALWSFNQWQRANEQTSTSEKVSRMAQNSALFSTVRESDPTLALSIAKYNYERHWGNNIVVVNQEQSLKDFTDLKFKYYSKVFRGHTSSGWSVAFSPDGKMVLTGSSDNTAKLWDLDGHEIQTFTGHSSSVRSVAFSPDGKIILTGSLDKTVKLWDLDGHEIQTFTGHSSAVSSVAFSPDGKTVLTGSNDNTAKLWDLNGREIQTFREHTSSVSSVAFSPDGKRVLTGSNDKTAKLWNLEGHEVQTFTGHSSYVWSVAFSPDGKTVLTGSNDKTAKLWYLNGHEIQTFTGHSSSVWSVAFSPDGKIVVTGSNDNTAKLWDMVEFKIQTFTGHPSSILSVAFSPDGKMVLTGSSDNTAKLWDLDGHEIQALRGHSSSVWSVAFSPDGQTVLTGSSDNTAKLWDLDGHEIQTFRGHSSNILSVAFSPDGKRVLTGSSDKTAKLWDLKGREIQTFRGHSSSIWSIAFSPDGKMVLTGSYDNTARLWDITGREIQTFTSYSSPIKSVAFSPDGKTLLMGNDDNTVKLCDLKGREIQTFKGYSSYILSVAFSPDGKMALTGNNDNTAKLWSIETRQLLKTFTGHIGNVVSLAFSPNGKTILTGSSDNTAKLWNIDTDCVECRAYQFSLEELWEAGVQLEPEDLKKIGKDKNKGQE